MKYLGHFDGTVPSLACIQTKQHGVCGGKIPLENPWKWPFSDFNFQNVPLDASALKNLCLWCEFQSRLLFIISLLLKTFLTALEIMLNENKTQARI